MRVLAVTQSYPKYPGDATAPFIASIVSALVARGHVVDNVLPYHPQFRQQDGDGVRVFPYPCSPADRVAPWGFGETVDETSRGSPAPTALIPPMALSRRRRLG